MISSLLNPLTEKIFKSWATTLSDMGFSPAMIYVASFIAITISGFSIGLKNGAVALIFLLMAKALERIAEQDCERDCKLAAFLGQTLPYTGISLFLFLAGTGYEQGLGVAFALFALLSLILSDLAFEKIGDRPAEPKPGELSILPLYYSIGFWEICTFLCLITIFGSGTAAFSFIFGGLCFASLASRIIWAREHFTDKTDPQDKLGA